MDMNLNINHWTKSSVTSTFMSTTSTASGFAIVSAPVKARRSTPRSKLQPEVFEPPPDYPNVECDHAQPEVHKVNRQSSHSAPHESEPFLQNQPQMTRQGNPNGRKFRNESSASTKPLLSQTSVSDTASTSHDCPPLRTVLRLEPGRHDISIEIRSGQQSPTSVSDRPFIVKTSKKDRKQCCTLPVKIMAAILAVVIVGVTVYLVIHFTVLNKPNK